jgi:citrate lyase subunit beta/citryl-CoA lyase
VIPIDTIHPRNVHDLEDLESRLKSGKNLGYEGMLVLNPIELPLVHQYYSPTQSELEWAKEIIKLSEEAVLEGKGVAIKNNMFIGPPMVKMAKNILKKKELIENKDKGQNE